MVATWPVNVTTPASVRTSTFLSCESLPRRVSTAFAMSLSLTSTACRAAGPTPWRSFFTDFMPSIPCATSLAALLASAESTLPRRCTTPLAVSTLIWVPFTRWSAKSAILVLEVSQLSLTIVLAAWVVVWAFSSAAPAASGAAATNAIKIAPVVIVVPYFIVDSPHARGSTRPTSRRLVVVLSPRSLDASYSVFLRRSTARTEAPSDGPAAPNELEHDDNGCDHQQQMDQPAAR